MLSPTILFIWLPQLARVWISFLRGDNSFVVSFNALDLLFRDSSKGTERMVSNHQCLPPSCGGRAVPLGMPRVCMVKTQSKAMQMSNLLSPGHQGLIRTAKT